MKLRLLAFGLICTTLCACCYFFLPFETRALVVAPAKYEEEIAKAFDYKVFFYPLPSQPDLPQVIDEICTMASEKRVHGLVSSNDYAGAPLVGIVSQKLGLIGPKPLSVLTCQHKYYSRLAQKESVPEATPAFSLGPNLPYPCFVKPVRSSFSRFAQVAHSPSDIQMPQDGFFDFFDQLIAYATPFKDTSERILAEEILVGDQLTWEGYIYKGKVETIGIVDSIMYPGTMCFERFDYPSQLPRNVQDRIATIASTYLNHVGLDNTLCNIEFMYNPLQDRISIIECNPRMALQFTDLYEKVDGTNSYEVALAIATGNKPHFKKNNGKHKVAASFVLRRFSNGFVANVPTQEEIETLQSLYPDLLVFVDVSTGKKLSDILQDGKSFRYGLIHLGAADKKTLFEHFEQCQRSLTFAFLDLEEEKITR